MGQSGFWADNKKAQEVTKTYGRLKEKVEFWEKLEQDLLALEKNPDEAPFQNAKARYEQARLTTFFSDKYDDHDAILSIHGGAGGLDAQDWAEMLHRMYLRFCEKRGFKTEILDFNRNPEGGIKSATFEVHGDHAYGYLKSEAGVHRLIRLSPFNPARTRETSFALVEVLPILEAQEETELDPKDLKIEAKTASGHGGQSVNTTYSAIRITHIPTGITVSIQNERSQTQNKEQALKILKAKLKKLEEEKNLEEKLKLRGEFKSPEWGNQIRSYTLHPYKLVKDHRTNFESNDPDKILDGTIDDFIQQYLELIQNAKIKNQNYNSKS